MIIDIDEKKLSLLINLGLSPDAADQLAMDLASEAQKARRKRQAKAMSEGVAAVKCSRCHGGGCVAARAGGKVMLDDCPECEGAGRIQAEAAVTR